MKGVENCNRHDSNYYTDEGCEYCYKEWQDKQKLIKEFIEDLNKVLDHDIDYSEGIHIVDVMEKYERMIKDEK